MLRIAGADRVNGRAGKNTLALRGAGEFNTPFQLSASAGEPTARFCYAVRTDGVGRLLSCAADTAERRWRADGPPAAAAADSAPSRKPRADESPDAAAADPFASMMDGVTQLCETVRARAAAARARTRRSSVSERERG